MPDIFDQIESNQKVGNDVFGQAIGGDIFDQITAKPKNEFEVTDVIPEAEGGGAYGGILAGFAALPAAGIAGLSQLKPTTTSEFDIPGEPAGGGTAGVTPESLEKAGNLTEKIASFPMEVLSEPERHVAEKAMTPFEMVNTAGQFYGDKVADLTGDTTLGAATKTLFEYAVFFGTPALVKGFKMIRKAKNAKQALALSKELEARLLKQSRDYALAKARADKTGMPLLRPDETFFKSKTPGKPDIKIDDRGAPIIPPEFAEVAPKPLRPDQRAVLEKKPIPEEKPSALLKPDTTPVKSETPKALKPNIIKSEPPPDIFTEITQKAADAKLKTKPRGPEGVIAEQKIKESLSKKDAELSPSMPVEDIKARRLKTSTDRLEKFRAQKGLRPLREIAKDIETALQGKAGLSLLDVNKIPEIADAKARLKGDLDIAQQIASDKGQSIVDYLKEQGFKPKDIKFILKYSEHTTVPKPQEVQQKQQETTIQETPPPAIGDTVGSMMDASRKKSSELRGTSLGKLKKSVVTKVLDVSGNLEKTLTRDLGAQGKEVSMRHNLIRGASSEAKRQFDIVSSDIYKDLSKAETQFLDEHILSTRAAEISKYKPDFQHSDGITAQEHIANIENFKEKIKSRLNVNEADAQKIYDKIKTKSDRYFNETQSQLKQMFDEGLISKETYNELRQYLYEPRKVLDYIDPDRTYTIDGKKVTVPDSGIKKLSDEGSLKLIETDSNLLLQEVVSRTQSRIFKNRANKALYDLATKHPENGIVKPSKIIGTTKDGKIKYQKAPSNHESITVMIDGHPKEMILPSEIAKEWIKTDPAIDSQLANALGWVTGNKILKAYATGYNPGFALTNIPRDIGLIYQATDVYSPTLPKFLGQLGIDVASVAKDAWYQKGRWTDYLKEGGGMDFLTTQGQLSTKFGGKLKTVQDYLSYINSFSERITRLALRERALKIGKTPTEATWEARNYLDFNKGGNWTKAVDTAALPYLGAGIQATRGLVRAGIKNPKLFAYKAANVMTLSTGLYFANTYMNPEALDEVPDREKEANFIITTPFHRIDKKSGKKRHFYIKIAKDQGQRVFSTLAEGVAEKLYNGKFPTEQALMAVQDAVSFLPFNKLPPAMTAWFGYTLNKNFWMNKDIWRKTYGDIDPKEEYTQDTHPFFKDVGQATGLSPERLKYSLSQLFTYSNPYVGLVGGGYKMATEGLPEKFKEESFSELLKSVPGASRIFKETPAYSEKSYREVKKVKKEENNRKWIQRREFDKHIDNYYQDKTQNNQSNIAKFIKTQPKEEKKSLLKRLSDYNKIKDLPNKWWWLDTKSLPPEARAVVFWNDWRQASATEQKEMVRDAEKIPGFSSLRFKKKLKEIKRQPK